MLFTLELLGVDESLTDPCLIVDEGQSLERFRLQMLKRKDGRRPILCAMV